MAGKKRPARKVRPKTPARVRKAKRKERGRSHPELVGLALFVSGLFLASVLLLGWDGGVAGESVARGLERLLGDARFALPPVLLVLGALMVARSRLVDVRPFRTGLALCAFGLLAVLDGSRGGAVGELLEAVLGRLVGATGTFLIGAFALTAGVVLLTGASIGALLRRSARAARTAGGMAATVARPAFARETARADLDPEPRGETRPPVDGETAFPDVVGDRGSVAAAPALLEGLADPEPTPAPEPAERAPEPTPQEPPLFPAAPSGRGTYRLPERSLLRKSRVSAGDPGRAAERTAEALVGALANFGVEATVVGQVAGPRVTRYELQLAPGTKVGKVASLKDDLAYALATTEIRILAPIPGKQAVGVEVPNLAPNIVTLGDIFDELPAGASPVSVWLGKDISGAAVWADLARMPHILIAGTTGSGKSGCINTMLCSILLRSTPDDVRMILVDPKRVELGLYESIPHLLTPVVSSPKAAAAVLANVLAEMERRYERMSLARARNLPELNRTLTGRGEDRLPYLLVVIDELADLMMVSPQEVEDAVIRLAQKSRAVGIHLVLATQRPSVDVITGMIKANVPSRIAFAVSSQTDSRVILDQAGAESLLGQGDMLFKPLGTSRLQRVQGAYVSEEEIALVVEACRGQREQELDASLLEAPGVEVVEAGDDEEFDPDADSLLARAIEIVVQTQTASVSLLQRRLRVGYTRAGRLIDMLERRGVISGYEGSKPRRVLVGEAELERVLADEFSETPS
ncbi:MAG: DNA translocase FtsK [Thermoleophilia bacterium]|nr:DNA translocase FtsK [Thermoleophilia bacterium]